MTPNKNQSYEKKHHFLFYLFKMDKNENPMPKKRADTLLQYLKQAIALGSRKNRGGD